VSIWTLARGRRMVSLPRLPMWWVVSLAMGVVFGSLAGRPVAVSLAVGAGPIVWVEGRRRVLRRKATVLLSSRWPDFLALVRGRIATGEPLADAVRVAARSMGDPFASLDRPWGGSFAQGLADIQMEWADPIADRVLTTIRVAAETGGAYVDNVLASLSLSLSDEIRLRRAHEAAVAQQQMTAGVALVAPWLILGLSVTTNPQASVEFATAPGRVVLALGAVATVVGFILARRAVRLSDPPRVFA